MHHAYQDGTAGFGALHVGAQFGQQPGTQEHFPQRWQIPSDGKNYYHLGGYKSNIDEHGPFQ
jgi:hypothetical protein